MGESLAADTQAENRTPPARGGRARKAIVWCGIALLFAALVTCGVALLLLHQRLDRVQAAAESRFTAVKPFLLPEGQVALVQEVLDLVDALGEVPFPRLEMRAVVERRNGKLEAALKSHGVGGEQAQTIRGSVMEHMRSMNEIRLMAYRCARRPVDTDRLFMVQRARFATLVESLAGADLAKAVVEALPAEKKPYPMLVTERPGAQPR